MKILLCFLSLIFCRPICANQVVDGGTKSAKGPLVHKAKSDPDPLPAAMNKIFRAKADLQEAHKANALLKGMLCDDAGVSDTGRTGLLSFDGIGTFATSSEGPFGPKFKEVAGQRDSKNGGDYRVRGEMVILTAQDKSRLELKVKKRQSDGRITELMYGKKLFAAGLCE